MSDNYDDEFLSLSCMVKARENHDFKHDLNDFIKYNQHNLSLEVVYYLYFLSADAEIIRLIVDHPDQNKSHFLVELSKEIDDAAILATFLTNQGKISDQAGHITTIVDTFHKKFQIFYEAEEFIRNLPSYECFKEARTKFTNRDLIGALLELLIAEQSTFLRNKRGLTDGQIRDYLKLKCLNVPLSKIKSILALFSSSIIFDEYDFAEIFEPILPKTDWLMKNSIVNYTPQMCKIFLDEIREKFSTYIEQIIDLNEQKTILEAFDEPFNKRKIEKITCDVILKAKAYFDFVNKRCTDWEQIAKIAMYRDTHTYQAWYQKFKDLSS
jgi:hypothetical protein